jgi:membrane fusion protein, copper/silver efflux system
MKKLHNLFALLALLGVLLSGFYVSQRIAPKDEGSPERRVLYYVDPMNPAHTSNKPGLAPCGMKLEPVYAEGNAGGRAPQTISSFMPPGTVKVSPEKQQIIGVQVGQADTMSASHTLRALGRVAADENRIYRVLAPTDGYMRDFPAAVRTGSMVQKDQLLASYFSAEPLAAQQAYLLALRAKDRRQNEPAFEEQTGLKGDSIDVQVRQAEENLRLAGVGETQMREIARSRQVIKSIELRAPITGLVVARNIFPYSRFERNTEFFRIVDLTRVWILADVFDHEEKYIRQGTSVRVSVPGHDKVLEGKVSDTLPQFDSNSRSYKVRLDVDNPELMLRPDALVNVVFSVQMQPAITVPREAVLDTGLKKIIYVDFGNGFFEPRKVETGLTFGDRVEIVGGLMPGERIVTSGNFLIDSESRMKLAASGAQGPTGTDPVCRMEVAQKMAEAAGNMSELDGTTYYFCTKTCKEEFDKSHARFIDKKAKEASHLEPVAVPASLPPPVHEARTNNEPQSMAVDPVCGEEVDRREAEATGNVSLHDGVIYYFSSDLCKQVFEKHSKHFLRRMKEGSPQHRPMDFPVSSKEPSAAEAPPQAQQQALAIDPVCGEKVDAKEAQAASHTSTHNGTTHYFCSGECKHRFDEDPNRWLPRPAPHK